MASFFLGLFEHVFGCSHSRTTFPITPSGSRAIASHRDTNGWKGTYVVCLKCGKEFDYDWKTMKVATKGLSSRAVKLIPGLENESSSILSR